MGQAVPDNRFNVCEELTFSRTFRKKSTERNKQDLKIHNLMISPLQTSITVFILRIKVLYKSETHAAATAQK